MSGGFTPRLAVEIVFLILLAVAAGLADLSPLVIGLVMGGAWALLVLVEWLAWRAESVTEAPPPAWTDLTDEPQPELDSWDIHEILAPLPEDADSEAEGRTSVLPPGELPSEPEERET